MKIRINGREVLLKGRLTILTAAREKGIDIPSLCDHPRLDPFAGCRLCLVEIKGRKDYAPACSTFAEEGMEVTTDSPVLAALRKNILALILSEHPHACLICAEKANCDDLKSTIRKVGEVTGCVLCSRNGRCELQNVVQALGPLDLDLPATYRGSEVFRDDPFIDRNYNLCILCGRCVRICHEVRGASVISFVSRGPEAVIGTPLGKTLLDSGCQFCGACVDVCPTGALEERAVKPETLPERKAQTICPFCSLGCRLEVGLAKGRILESRPSEAGPVNRGQACVKGRFGVREAVMTSARILRPMLRSGHELMAATWEDAIASVASKLETYDGGETAFVVSPQSPIEDLYVLYKFAREGLKARYLGAVVGPGFASAGAEIEKDHGLRLPMNFDIGEISKAKTLFILGTDLALSHPMVWLEAFAARRKGAEMFVAHSGHVTLARQASSLFRIRPASEAVLLQAILASLPGKTGASFSEDNRAVRAADMTGVTADDIKALAAALGAAKPLFIILGPEVARVPGALAAAWNLGLALNGRVVPLDRTINEKGVFEIGRHFSASGIEWEEILEDIRQKKIKALYLAGPAPELREDRPEYLVCQATYWDENARSAQAVLPSATFAETGGGFVNTEGRVQIFDPAMDPRGESKSDAWIAARLAETMRLTGFEAVTPGEIRGEMAERCPGFHKAFPETADPEHSCFLSENPDTRISFLPVAGLNQSRQTGSAGGESFLVRVLPEAAGYKELELSREIKGLRRIRNSSWIFMNGEDARRCGAGEGAEVEILSAHGALAGLVRISETVFPGTVETSLPLSSPLFPIFFKEGSVTAKIRRKS